MHFTSTGPWALLSGAIWGLGNIASLYAVWSPLGVAIGYPLSQVCTMFNNIFLNFQKIKSFYRKKIP